MIKYASFLVLLLAAFSTQAQSTAERNKATLLRMSTEVFSQGKLDVVDALFAPSFVDHNPPSPQLPAGLAGVKGTVAMFREAFPDFTMRQVDAVAEGNKVTQRWICSGTMKNAFLGAPPTGKSFTIEGIDIVYFDASGKITERWGQLDVLGMLAQLGLQK